MRLADFILANVEPILCEWEAFAATIPSAAGMQSVALRDHAQKMLISIARDLRTSQSAEDQESKSKGEAPPDPMGRETAAEVHASGRFNDGFDLDQMVSEYRALRASVIRLWAPTSGGPEALRDLTRFNEAIDQALTESIQRYSSHLNRSRELFMGILGHDLRTPLGSIIMSAQFLLQAPDLGPDEHTKSLTRILSSANRIKAMVSDLLDVALTRLGGTLPLLYVPMDLAKSCRDSVEESRAVHAKADLKLELSGDLQGTWDAGRISQILANLIENAIRYGSADAPIEVSARGHGDQVELKVHNSGAAIPAAKHQRIFEPMVREANARDQSGMGLGLYITAMIVKAFGGTIVVASAEDTGTTFIVHLPRRPPAAPPLGESKAASEAKPLA